MDFLLELIIQVVLEGTLAISASESKKVPMAVRIFSGLVSGLVYVGFCGILIMEGITSKQPFLIVIGIGIFLLFAAIFISKCIGRHQKDK